MPALTESKESCSGVAWPVVLLLREGQPLMVKSVHIINRRQPTRFIERVRGNSKPYVKQIALLSF